MYAAVQRKNVQFFPEFPFVTRLSFQVHAYESLSSIKDDRAERSQPAATPTSQ